MQPLLSVRVVAKRLDVTTETVRRWIADGKLSTAGRTPGGHYRVSEEQLAATLAPPPGPTDAERAAQKEVILGVLAAARAAGREARREWTARG